MRFRRRTLTRLKLLLVLVVLAALGAAILLFMQSPQLVMVVGGVGAAVAIVTYFVHRDAAMLFASVFLYPILALGIYALHAVLGVPVEYLVYISIPVFALVLLVLTAEELPM